MLTYTEEWNRIIVCLSFWMDLLMSQSIDRVGLRDQDSDTHVDLVTFAVSNPVQE